ncbi:unnamed protein product [Rotaria sordida]|uniref:Uncharacterized protein n=1 Tax=Rotaria sordida TaxID=392033 RepID=A0A815KK69_9BILA|nr:unnamed protein product [Rotaria sordida]CAF1473858.1 unnamed protein product [Rotaria sordida]CAF3972654.1 unnamed protein product [Rotaria sordida]CAF4031976.1 unnamed protein product [Rotaria sordida]
MDVDLEDALELANEKHQLYLKKREGKSRQSRLNHQDFDFVSSQSISSSSVKRNHSTVFLSSIKNGIPGVNADVPKDEDNTSDDVIDYDTDEDTQAIKYYIGTQDSARLFCALGKFEVLYLMIE